METNILSVCKIFEISYAHWLQDYDGKCAEMHGHNAMIELEFKDSVISPQGNQQHFPNSGMVLDFSAIKEGAEQKVKETFDHKCINSIPYFKKYRPTAENMIIYIRNEILPENHFPTLTRIRFWEDRDSYAEWKAED